MSGEVVGLSGSVGSLGVTKLSIPAKGFRPRAEMVSGVL